MVHQIWWCHMTYYAFDSQFCILHSWYRLSVKWSICDVNIKNPTKFCKVTMSRKLHFQKTDYFNVFWTLLTQNLGIRWVMAYFGPWIYQWGSYLITPVHWSSLLVFLFPLLVCQSLYISEISHYFFHFLYEVRAPWGYKSARARFLRKILGVTIWGKNRFRGIF